MLAPGTRRQVRSYRNLRAVFQRTGGERPALWVRVFVRRGGGFVLRARDRYGLFVPGPRRLLNQLGGGYTDVGAPQFAFSFTDDHIVREARSGRSFMYQCTARGRLANRLGKSEGAPSGVMPDVQCSMRVLDRSGQQRTNETAVLVPEDPGVRVRAGRLTLWVNRIAALEDGTYAIVAIEIKPRGPYEQRNAHASVWYNLPKFDDHKLLNQLRGFAGDPDAPSFTGLHSYTDPVSGLTVEHSCRSLEPGA